MIVARLVLRIQGSFFYARSRDVLDTANRFKESSSVGCSFFRIYPSIFRQMSLSLSISTFQYDSIS